MKGTEELQRDIDQFDFRLIRETRAVKTPDGGLSVTHTPPDSARQRKETGRFRTFVEKNWTVREVDFAACFHPAGMFRPHEDEDARTTRTKISGTRDECLVERREPAEVCYAGFGFATWEEAKAFDEALRALQREALMLLGACAALGLHGANLRHGLVKNNIDADQDSALDATIAQLRHDVAEAVKART